MKPGKDLHFMAGRVLTIKDPFRAMAEFRLWELESFIHISQKASEEFTRRSKGGLEKRISRTIKENKSADPVAIIQILPTPVGMVQTTNLWLYLVGTFSPHAWGWSELSA